MKFVFAPPASAVTEKVKVEVSPQILAWADGLAQQHGSTREAVLEQAITFAHTSAVKAVRVRKPK